MATLGKGWAMNSMISDSSSREQITFLVKMEHEMGFYFENGAVFD